MGFSTTKWGPPGWEFLFCAALNHEFNDIPGIDEKYIAFFENLSFVLPCSFCVEYYSILLKEYPINSFLEYCRKRNIKYALFTWLYFIKDKVNEKLIKQETECLKKELAEIDNLDIPLTNKKKLARVKTDYILYTQKTPDFEVVLSKYMSYKSNCNTDTNKALKSCRHLPPQVFF